MAKLSKAARAKIPSSKFAEPGKRKFPLNDRDHDKAAIMDSGGNKTVIRKARAALKRLGSRGK